MKKFLALFLTAALLLAMLAACTGDNPQDTNSPDPTAGASATVSPTDNTQEPSVGLPTEEPTAEPSQDQTPETQAPATEAPATQPPSTNPPATNPPATNPPATQPPATNPPATNPPATDPPEPSDDPEPSQSTTPGFPGGVVIPGFGGGLGGLGGGTTEPTPEETPVAPNGRTDSDKDLEAFYQSLLDGDDALLSGMDVNPLPDDYMTAHAYGWISTPCVQRTAYMSMASTLPNVIALIQVNNASEVLAVKAILNSWIETEASDPFGYNPIQWQQYAYVVSEGNYVMMIVSRNYEAVVDAFHAFFK